MPQRIHVKIRVFTRAVPRNFFIYIVSMSHLSRDRQPRGGAAKGLLTGGRHPGQIVPFWSRLAEACKEALINPSRIYQRFKSGRSRSSGNVFNQPRLG